MSCRCAMARSTFTFANPTRMQKGAGPKRGRPPPLPRRPAACGLRAGWFCVDCRENVIGKHTAPTADDDHMNELQPNFAAAAGSYLTISRYADIALRSFAYSPIDAHKKNGLNIADGDSRRPRRCSPSSWACRSQLQARCGGKTASSPRGCHLSRGSAVFEPSSNLDATGFGSRGPFHGSWLDQSVSELRIAWLGRGAALAADLLPQNCRPLKRRLAARTQCPVGRCRRGFFGYWPIRSSQTRTAILIYCRARLHVTGYRHCFRRTTSLLEPPSQEFAAQAPPAQHRDGGCPSSHTAKHECPMRRY